MSPNKWPGQACLARRESYVDFVGQMEARLRLCRILAQSGSLGSITSAEAAFAIALQGAELGLPAMTALANIYVIEGKPSMSAGLMMALVLRDLPGTTFEFEHGPDYCQVTVTRPGWKPYVSRFSLGDAQAAGLLGREHWQKYPANMLRSRALANACRVVAPEVLAGMYTPEEHGATVLLDAAGNEKVLAAAELPPAPPAPISFKQKLELKSLKDRLGIDGSEWRSLLGVYGVRSAHQLDNRQAEALLERLRDRLATADHAAAEGPGSRTDKKSGVSIAKEEHT